MKIVIAPDSYKGSLSAMEVTNTIEQAFNELGNHEIIKKPMADGGEGTIEAILTATNGQEINLTTAGPLGDPIETSYAIIKNSTAIIETAMHAGLYQVPNDKRNPDHTTTYGMGEAILDALDRGCKEVIVGLGGSATNDGGLGLLQALGLKAYNEQGEMVDKFGKDLRHIDSIDMNGVDPRLKNIKFRVACDVDNPLCGKLGASVVYGPQKGANASQIKEYDQALANFADLMEDTLQNTWRDVEGAGAAGGLGFAFLTIGGTLESGASLIAEAINLEENIQQADFVITGEGQSDEQTLYGKAPGYVADLGNAHQVPTILLSGSLGEENEKLREKFAGCFSIVNKPISLEECMNNSKHLLTEQSKQILTLIQALKA